MANSLFNTYPVREKNRKKAVEGNPLNLSKGITRGARVYQVLPVKNMVCKTKKHTHPYSTISLAVRCMNKKDGT